MDNLISNCCSYDRIALKKDCLSCCPRYEISPKRAFAQESIKILKYLLEIKNKEGPNLDLSINEIFGYYKEVIFERDVEDGLCISSFKMMLNNGFINKDIGQKIYEFTIEERDCLLLAEIISSPLKDKLELYDDLIIYTLSFSQNKKVIRAISKFIYEVLKHKNFKNLESKNLESNKKLIYSSLIVKQLHNLTLKIF